MKSLYIYQCDQPLSSEFVEGDLERMKFIPPMPQSMESSGWSPFEDNFAILAPPYAVMQYRQDKKILPKSTVEDEMAQRSESMGDLNASEKRQLKEDVLMHLRPKAFSRRQDVSVIWHQALKQIWVGTSSATRADATMECILQTWPGLRATRWLDNHALRSALTNALKEDKWPEGVTAADKVVMVHPQEQKRKVAIQGVDASYEGVMSWLNQGFVVQQLKLVYDGKVEMTFSEQGYWSAIKDLTVNDILDEAENDPHVRLWHQCALIESLVKVWEPWLQEVEACLETTVS